MILKMNIYILTLDFEFSMVKLFVWYIAELKLKTIYLVYLHSYELFNIKYRSVLFIILYPNHCLWITLKEHKKLPLSCKLQISEKQSYIVFLLDSKTMFKWNTNYLYIKGKGDPYNKRERHLLYGWQSIFKFLYYV